MRSEILGAFIIGASGRISVLQALALANGLAPDAKRKEAKILRPTAGQSRQEIALNLDKILKGQTEDLLLRPGDAIYVPSGGGVSKWARTIAGAGIVAAITTSIWTLR